MEIDSRLCDYLFFPFIQLCHNAEVKSFIHIGTFLYLVFNSTKSQAPICLPNPPILTNEYLIAEVPCCSRYYSLGLVRDMDKVALARESSLKAFARTTNLLYTNTLIHLIHMDAQTFVDSHKWSYMYCGARNVAVSCSCAGETSDIIWVVIN